MNNTVRNPETCAAGILNCGRDGLEPEAESTLEAKIAQHKWCLSEQLGRDVGINVARLDFMENVYPQSQGLHQGEGIEHLKELGAQIVDRAVWETISESQPPKQIVNKRIILPLTQTGLAHKHGVSPPRNIIFFGPPGTGKTHFVRAIAGVLQWWYVEVSPSRLMADGQDRLGANLKNLMETVRKLDEAVVFIDEFEEIAASRDQASRIDKSITNEFLKQVPLLKREERKSLLVCATNYIRQLDAALLRPGRFDCIIPVGGLDDQGRRTIFEHYLARVHHGAVDVDKLVAMTPLYTPADIEYLFQKVRQDAFEREYDRGEDFLVTTDDFVDMISMVKPTLTQEIINEFEEDCAQYTRY